MKAIRSKALVQGRKTAFRPGHSPSPHNLDPATAITAAATSTPPFPNAE